MYIGKRQQSWEKWLYLYKFTYNQRLHSSIGCSSFFVLYGQDCKTPMTTSTPTSSFEHVNQNFHFVHKKKQKQKTTW